MGIIVNRNDISKIEIEEFIASVLVKKQAIPTNVAFQDYRYIESGHIDSLGIMKFILQIENQFQIEINDEDMLTDSFQFIGGLVKIIQNKLN